MRSFVVERHRIISDWRRMGWRAALKHAGWRLIAAVVAFYLVRDLLLYVAVPMGMIAIFR